MWASSRPTTREVANGKALSEFNSTYHQFPREFTLSFAAKNKIPPDTQANKNASLTILDYAVFNAN